MAKKDFLYVLQVLILTDVYLQNDWQNIFLQEKYLLKCETNKFICPWRQIRNQPLRHRAIFVFP